MSKLIEQFRTQRCVNFADRKCPFHKPTACFHWHFENQKRRSVHIKEIKDGGLYNYSADIYCTSYDEDTGHCSYGDQCRFLHRNYGDTERAYHPRYLRTSICPNGGQCSEWCPYAHSITELRNPHLDSSHLRSDVLSIWSHRNMRFKSSFWNNLLNVLIYYKSEKCPDPSRHCRNMQACPYYHSKRDHRRPWVTCKYSASLCHSVKDESYGGGNANMCQSHCEQQFHPEVYKSSKCSDVLDNAYCPRGVFCAFAHCQSEFETDFAALLLNYCHSCSQSTDFMPVFGSPSLHSISSTDWSHLSHSFPIFGGHLGAEDKQLTKIEHLRRSGLLSTRMSCWDDLASFKKVDPVLPKSSEDLERFYELKRLCYNKVEKVRKMERVVVLREDELHSLGASDGVEHPKLESELPQFELDMESGDVPELTRTQIKERLSLLKEAIARVTRTIEHKVKAKI